MAKYVTDDNLTKYDTLLKLNVAILARNTAYTAGTIVQKGQNYLKCLTGGTTSTGALVINGGYGDTLTDGTVTWQIIDYYNETKMFDYKQGVYYEVGRLALYNNKIYRCKTAHTAPATIVYANWELLSGDTTINDWQTSTDYDAGTIVINNGSLYRATTSHTSDSTGFINDMANWELITSDLKWWSPGTDYKVGVVVIQEGLLYYCTADHTSDNTDFNNDSANWVEIGRYFTRILDWQANHAYTVNDVVLFNKYLYRCTTAHTSAEFRKEDSNWLRVDAGIHPWVAQEQYVAGNTVHKDYKLYRNIKNDKSSVLTRMRWRPYIPVIEDWGPYNPEDIGDLLFYQNFASSNKDDWVYDAFGSYTATFTEAQIYVEQRENFGNYLTFNYAAPFDFNVVHTDMQQWLPDCDGRKAGADAVMAAGGLTIEFWHYGYHGGHIGAMVWLFDNASHYQGTTVTNQYSWNNFFNSNPVSGWTHVSINFVFTGWRPYLENRPFLDFEVYQYVNGVLTYSGSYSQVFSYDWRVNDNTYLTITCCPTGASGQYIPFSIDDIQVWLGRKRTANFTPPTKQLDIEGTRFVPYIEGEYVIKDSKLYRCIEGNTDIVWKPEHWEKISVEDASSIIDDWKTETDYEEKDLIVYNNKLYRCNTAHTSDTGGFGNDSSYWTLISGGGGSGGSGISDWATSTAYSIGDLVLHGNSIYKCTTDHTSSTWKADGDNWVLVGMLKEWTANTDYIRNDLIVYEGQIYVATNNFTSGGGFTTSNLAKFVPNDLTEAQIRRIVELWGSGGGGGSGSGLQDWEANHDYTEGDILVYNGQIYKVTADFTSGDSFSVTNLDRYVPKGLVQQQIQNIINLFNSSGGAALQLWKSNTDYVEDQLLVYEGQIYRVNTDFTSGVTFDDTYLDEFVPQGLTTQQKQEVINLFGGSPANKSRGLIDWAATTDYTQYSLIVYDGVIYQATQDFTSGSEFSDTYLDVYVPTALTSTDLDNIVDAFDPSSGGGAANVSYSTDEQVVGTWIDGKPVYQITIVADNISVTAGGYTSIIGNIVGVNNVVESTVFFQDSNRFVQLLPGNWSANNGGTHTGSNTWLGWSQIDLNTGNIVVGSSITSTWSRVTATVRYTKITD